MLHKVKTTRPLDEIERGLEESAARHRFGILTVHDLRQTMAKKGVEFKKECRIYEVCNPHQAKKVLEVDGAVSTALPCRISVYEEDGGYTLATILPTALMNTFGVSGLDDVAREVEAVMIAMMREAAGA